ncbi:MAG: hypothetical protein GY811_23960, partial [Myxococcales bacterium]|nr:hypothetical protein [Myxococcales bacterium]
LSQRLADCFTDHRRADLVDHTVQELLAQRILGLSLGYEALDDQDELAKDPLPIGIKVVVASIHSFLNISNVM